MNEFYWQVRVYYEDTDAGGVVYYANYLKFLERARTEFLRSLGFEQTTLMAEQNTVFVVHSVNIDYIKPARLDDLLQVSAKVIECKKTSLFFEQIVLRGQEVLCRGVVRIASLDLQTMKPKLFPLEILEKIT
jgi:acyl-CoA thioester hydrolase